MSFQARQKAHRKACSIVNIVPFFRSIHTEEYNYHDIVDHAPFLVMD